MLKLCPQSSTDRWYAGISEQGQTHALAWGGAGICKGTGGGITLSFCPKLVHLYPIMALCLQTWELEAEGLKAACSAVIEHPHPTPVW